MWNMLIYILRHRGICLSPVTLRQPLMLSSHTVRVILASHVINDTCSKLLAVVMCLNAQRSHKSLLPHTMYPKLHIACKDAQMSSRCFCHHFLLQGSTAWHSTDHLSGVFLLRGVSTTGCRGLVCQHSCCRPTSLPILLNDILPAKQQSLWQLAALYTSLCILSVVISDSIHKEKGSTVNWYCIEKDMGF